MHRAQVSGGNRKRVRRGNDASGYTARCLHLSLTETFDAYEHWDTIHDVPGKLSWGIFAFQHTAALLPDGTLDGMDGVYVSWANQYTGKMLSEADVELLTTALNLSQTSAQSLEAIYGPTVVYNREVLQKWNNEIPERTDSEWIDEQIALMNKYGAMSLAVRRLEDGLGAATSQEGGLDALLIHATTSELSDASVPEITKAP